MQHWNSILNLDRVIQILICGALRDLVPSVQFKKREKHQWRSVTFSKACNFTTKSNTPPRVFFTYFKLYKWYQIAQRISFIFPHRNFIDFESSKFVEENPNIAVYFKKRNRKPPRLIANYCKSIDYLPLGKRTQINEKVSKMLDTVLVPFLFFPDAYFGPCQISLMELL